MRVRPYPEIDWCDAEDEKLQQLHAAGWELYDSAEVLGQNIASIGNMLRNISGMINSPADVGKLKADKNDQRLMIYLERVEEQISSGSETLTALEEQFRQLRCELVQLSYKQKIPAEAGEGMQQKALTEF